MTLNHDAIAQLPNHVTVSMTGGGSIDPWLALFGTVLTVVVGLVTFLVSRKAKQQELLLGALDFLCGGTQKRAVGIAVAEYYANEIGMRPLIVQVLIAQQIHLRSGGHDQPDSDSKVEQKNYQEIARILRTWNATPA